MYSESLLLTVTGSSKFSLLRRRGWCGVCLFLDFAYCHSLTYAETKLILTKVLWHFDLELCKESENWPEGKRVWLLWERGPLMVKPPVVRE
jgi:hypothetical protein